MPRIARSALQYLAAVAVPVIVAEFAPFEPAVSPFFLCIGIFARFFGFGPALVSILSSSWMLWTAVLPATANSMHLQITRLGLFMMSSLVVASVSLRRSEEKRETDQRYRDLVELTPEGIAVIEQAGVTILFANRGLASILGVSSAAELIGKDVSVFMNPDAREASRREIVDLLAGRLVPPVEQTWTRADGAPVLVEIGAVVPIKSRGTAQSQMFLRDLTQRKLAEARAEESVKRLRALFDEAMEAILFFDSNKQYVDANACATELLGYTHDEIVREQIGFFARPEDLQSRLDFFRLIVEDGRTRGEAVMIRKDGELREVEYSAVANVLPNLHVVMMHDISKRKEAERSLQKLSVQLLHSQDDERRRIAMELHETTAQSLAALRLNLVRINKALSAGDSAMSKSIGESIALTEQSIKEIRTLSYLLYPPMIDEAGLVASLRWYLRGFEERSGIKATLDAPPELAPLPRDRETAVFRIVQEGLNNIQRHAQSGVARIRLREDDHRLLLEIEDEGRGMPAHLRDDRHAVPTAGVGIAAMQQRVKDLGGELEIRSGDGGTMIVVSLPIPEPESVRSSAHIASR